MESPGSEQELESLARSKDHRIEVITVRNWKEYLGESLLIIFSVILALSLTEWFTNWHDERRVHEILHQLRGELIRNKESELDQYQYHQKIFRNIDSATKHPEYAGKFLHNGEIHLDVIIDSGVLKHDLDDVAWQIAKQNNAFSKLDLSTYSLLTEIYDNQQRITKLEDEVGRVLLNWESRKPENLRTTLILIRDNYVAWSVQRAPFLIRRYTEAIEDLKEYSK